MPASLARTLLVCALAVATARSLAAQTRPDWQRPPIDYQGESETDAVAELRDDLARGELILARDPQLGLLPGLLEALDVPTSSQTLVFSKTSFQNDLITTRRPRAVYFGDRAYVGYVPGSNVLEVSTADPQRGALFYTVTDDGTARPRIERDQGSCLRCHAFAWTRDRPGHLLRSVFVSERGVPIQRLGSDVVHHETPYEDRWGGWYVTGTHGELQHRGNVVVSTDQKHPETPPGGLNLQSIEQRIDSASYPHPHSDLVALLVLEHQTQMHNLIAWANYEATATLERQAAMNRALDQPEGHRSATTKRQLHGLADDILRYLLFRDEPPLPAPVRGTSNFAAEFSARGPRDSQGRSLRELDLETRLFRYPCSYVIQSETFAALHADVREVVLLRLHRILARGFGGRSYRHLDKADRRAILEILRDTMPDLPSFWHESREPLRERPSPDVEGGHETPRPPRALRPAHPNLRRAGD